MDFPQALTGFGKAPEVGRIGKAREVTSEVRSIPLPIFRVMEQSVSVIEDVPFTDGILSVMCPELCQRPIGDVFPSVCTVLVVGVEGETLGTTLWQHIGNFVDY